MKRRSFLAATLLTLASPVTRLFRGRMLWGWQLVPGETVRNATVDLSDTQFVENVTFDGVKFIRTDGGATTLEMAGCTFRNMRSGVPILNAEDDIHHCMFDLKDGKVPAIFVPKDIAKQMIEVIPAT